MNFFYKLPLPQMLRLNVVRCAGLMLQRPELLRLLGLKKKPPVQDPPPKS